MEKFSFALLSSANLCKTNLKLKRSYFFHFHFLFWCVFLASLALLLRSSRISIKLCVTLSRISVSASCQPGPDCGLRTTETSLMELPLSGTATWPGSCQHLLNTKFQFSILRLTLCLMVGLAAELGQRAGKCLPNE